MGVGLVWANNDTFSSGEGRVETEEKMSDSKLTHPASTRVVVPIASAYIDFLGFMVDQVFGCPIQRLKRIGPGNRARGDA